MVELITVIVVLGLLVGIAVPRLQMVIDEAKVARAIGDLRALQADIVGFEAAGQALPLSLADIDRAGLLDPWGRPYVYFNFATVPGHGAVPPGARRDRFLVPINSSFDLYSLGKDGQSNPALTSADSQDDIVRGNDGGFLGLARLF